jgi:hypothetical protein
VDHLEAAGQALRHPLLDEKRRRPQQHDLERTTSSGVGVPQALDGLRPARNLLDLVQHQKGFLRSAVAKPQASRLPLGVDPLGPAERRLVGACEDVRNSRGVNDVGDQRRLADLARAGDDLHEVPRLLEASQQLCGLWPDVFLNTHHVE